MWITYIWNSDGKKCISYWITAVNGMYKINTFEVWTDTIFTNSFKYLVLNLNLGVKWGFK